jgi:hypothetical protein
MTQSAPVEDYVKNNSYTVSVVTTQTELLDNYDGQGLSHKSTVTRSFNFLAAQVTTVTRDLVYQSKGYHNGGSAAVSTNTIVQNFDEVAAAGEIRLMHDRLEKLGGHPPPLEEVLPEAKQKLRLPAGGNRP